MLSLSSPLSLCAWCVSPEYGSISRFKGVFRGFYGVRVGLCCLRALRGLCGFCARVELGGLKACCVFAFISSLSHPFFIFLCPCVCSLFMLFAYLLGLCLCCPRLVLLHCLCGSLGVLLFLFPFRTTRQKERAQRFVPCVLSLRVSWVALSGCGFIFLVLVRCQPVYIVIKF